MRNRRQEKKNGKDRKECKKIFTIMHNRHYLLLRVFFFSRSCPACQRAIRISFVMFPICARRIKKKKKISFNHNHMMIMMSMNISHAKRKILFYQTYQISIYALQIVRSSLIIINHHLFRSVVIGITLAKNLFPSLSCVHSDEEQRECGKEDIIPKKLSYVARAEILRGLFYMSSS